MPFIDTNGTRLYYELQGDGPTLVFVHGAWGDHHVWDGIAPALARSFTILTYDRRGHSQSVAPLGPQGIAEDAEDLDGMLTALDLGPVHLVGTSGGAAMALHFANQHGEKLLSVAAHEPPFLDMVANDSRYAPMLASTKPGIEHTISLIEAGEHIPAAEFFLDNVAVGPGAWEQLPDAQKTLYAANAPTFLDDSRDPLLFNIDTDKLAEFPRSMLITRGDQSPPFYHGVFDLLRAAVPNAEYYVFEGAGHSPYRSHPEPYVEELQRFVRQVDS